MATKRAVSFEDVSPLPQKRRAVSFEEVGAEPEASFGTKAEAAIEGFGRGAIPFAGPSHVGAAIPNLARASAPVRMARGLIGAANPNDPERVNQDLRSQGFQVEDPEDSSTYLSRRDSLLNRADALQKAAPGYFAGGQVVGALASAPAYGGAVGLLGKGLQAAAPARLAATASRAPGLVKSVATGSLGGATQSAVMNPGDVQGELNPIQAEERIDQAKTGAKFGAAVPLVGAALSSAGRATLSAAKGAKQASNDFYLKTAGAIQKHFKKMSPKEKEEVASFIKKSGVAPVGASFETVYENSDKLMDDAWKKIDGTIKANNMEGKTLFRGKDVFNRVSQSIEENLKKNNLYADTSDLMSDARMRPLFKKLQSQGVLTLEELNDLRKGVDKVTKSKAAFRKMTEGAGSEMSAEESAAVSFRNTLKDLVQERIEKISGEGGLKGLQDANRQYSMASKVNKIARDGVDRSGNRLFGLTDLAAGGALGFGTRSEGEDIITSGGKALGGALLSKAGKKYGPGIMARGLERAAPAIGGVASVPSVTGGLLREHSQEITGGLLRSRQKEKK